MPLNIVESWDNFIHSLLVAFNKTILHATCSRQLISSSPPFNTTVSSIECFPFLRMVGTSAASKTRTGERDGKACRA